VPVGNVPFGITVTPDGKKVYVTNSDEGTVSVINTKTNTVTSIVPVGFVPRGVTVTSDGKKVYVANSLNNTVSVINTAKNRVIATVPVGIRPIAFGKFIGNIQMKPKIT
jgi:YVTN family beta-propeller protein